MTLIRGSAESSIIEQWKLVARLKPDASLRGGDVFFVIVACCNGK